MSNRFGRDASRNSLFSTYDNPNPSSSSQPTSRSTSPSKYSKSKKSPSNGYGYQYKSTPPYPQDHLSAGPAFAAYPGVATPGGGFGAESPDPFGQVGGYGADYVGSGMRSATPNNKGQYSTAVLDELESQNDEQVGMLTSKVRDLKNLTHLIGHEIRDSSALADKMNDQFENSRLKLKGTMKRMLRMAEKTGVGWRVWVGFFAFVCLLFWYVWLF